MVIMLVAIGSLVVASDAANKSKKLRFAMDNINFALESMSRSIRIGTNYSCYTSGIVDLSSSPATADCTNGNFIAFRPAESASNVRIGYGIESRGDGTNTLKRCDNSNTCVDIISPDIDIQLLKFFVTGSSSSDTIQPSVYMVIKGSIIIKGVPTTFAMQTMASQRSAE
jgi:hypothetical protein